ncbi:hypothetical protein DPMN_075856 [Dreissena polymorpha]|uniref:Ig-like domain-containing protein n=1 Tax=Dreissena polymorpha TaxID=45954 RepID=A0A9D4BF97_DREPO|nr:hypothetical protein DPMN_075856 [Dreissena polymorpha]
MLGPRIMKLHRYIDHDSQMTPIDFEVTRIFERASDQTLYGPVMTEYGILCIQASKFASLGGQQILDCDLNFPGGRPVTYMLDWKKEGLRDSVLVKYDGYAANVHESYSGRARLVKEISLEISHIQESDEGWYECKVIYIDGTDNREANGTWIYLNVYIAPKIDVAHYQEGDLIKATYQKQTYDAVISEIHHDEVSLEASKATA